MKRFKNISLVFECDQSTLERAATLAKDNRAKLTIAYPSKQLTRVSKHLSLGDQSIDVQSLVRQELQARLDAAAKSLRPLGVRPSTRLLAGDPFLEIIRDVITNDRDLVIMTAEGKGGLRQRLFGSTSKHLMRKCPVPLLVTKPARRKRFNQVLAAIDPTVTGESRDTLNKTILELARSLSAREDADLHVVHAWRLLGESMLRGRGRVPPEDVDHLVLEEKERHRCLVEAMLKKHAVSGHRLHLPKGEAAEVIPRLIGKLAIDLLVMGTVCRTGVPGFIMGNTAERVLDVVDCSVLVVKPEGFVSPVAPLILADEEET